ncbi:MAG: hypothetical protein QXT14_02785 [Candidatus Bathyarchaeia archaeon]
MSTYKTREILGYKKPENHPKSVDEELEERLEEWKRRQLEKDRWLEFEEMVKRRELAIAELDKKLDEIKGLSSNAGQVLPKLSKEELEVVKLLLEMKEEDRLKAIQMMTLLKGGVSTAMPIIASSGSDVSKIAETVNAIVSAVKSLTPQPQTGADVRDTLLTTVLNKWMELMEKRASEARGDRVDEFVNALLSYAVQQLTSPRGSEIEYLSNNLDKLQNLLVRLIPQPSGSSALDTAKIWLEMRKMDQEYEKWKTEMNMKREAEERKMEVFKKAIETLDLGGLVKSALPTVASSIRGPSKLPTVLCDPAQGGCGSQIPVPPNAKEVVCAVCGKAWRIGEPKGEATEPSK